MTFTRFKVIAERADGTFAKFTIHDHDDTPRPERGTTHDDAFNAETDLHNRLVRLYMGKDRTMSNYKVCADCGSLYDANSEGWNDLCDRCYNFEEEED